MTQTKETNDIVLKSTRGILVFTKWIIVLGVAAIAIAIAVLPFVTSDLLKEMGKAFVSPPGLEAIWMIVGIMVLGIMIFLLTLFAVNRLRRIVDSVGQGNPFTRVNGTRLRGIGIAAFVIQLLTFIAGLIFAGLIAMLGEVKPGADVDLNFEAGFSITGILLVLLPIILARVFDRGAEMQDELEGTI